ncbi:HlyD family type I secretion periplasmic adaptor subunit [Rodentibacter haemolyticus]|uniref:Membrane fusion protein (MFP) family protein n=1 Tax=Rodentibacter haemolyticus TaxID=2778911 RepID=A0ABX6UVM3_9PAST|nr:HlyD family type I secretion periplasmic adaptor subunit [Rodentibacter haemolyticus]QPB42117.1 HlyD family type I secretion periplasmic adaptor subunit [Rodentibacter haemolyticus]
MKTWLMGVYEFFLRYRSIWRDTWKIRHELDSPIREKDEHEFLPAHLELIETPVSKKPRAIAYFIMAFLVLALILSIWGKVEIVATAGGKLVYNGHSKEIKPIENAIVDKILVQEGDKVQQGDILLKLTALGADADALKTHSSLQQMKLEQYRYQLLSQAIEKGYLPPFELPKERIFEDLDENTKLSLKSLVEEQFSTWQKQKRQKALNLTKKEAEKLTALARIKRYEGVSKIEKSRLNDFKILLKEKSVSKHAVLEQENKYLEAINELAVYQSQLQQIENEILLAKEEYELVTQLFKNEVLDKLRQVTDNIKISRLELDKNKQRQQASVIKAPVSGKIQQLKTHTEGGVVTTAETLMVIVPEEDTLEVVALIPNKDIGFVNQGQEAIIKLEAFPYTRYGYLTGKVKNINLDAIEHQQLGLVFSTIISIDKNTLFAKDKEIALTSGMAVTAEIKTGMRTVISYLLSPLEESFSEGLRER